MLGTLARLGLVATLRRRLERLRHRGVLMGVAAAIGFFAILFLLDAARLGLALWLPVWAATLLLAALLLLGAWLLVWSARRDGQRQRLAGGGPSLAMPAVLPLLAALRPQVTGLLRRHGMELTVVALVSLGLLARARAKEERSEAAD